jgi:hypothetical protein
MLPSHLRVWDLVEFSLAERGKKGFLEFYERVMEDKEPQLSIPRKIGIELGRVHHGESSYLWQNERNVVRMMYERNRYSKEEFFKGFDAITNDLVTGGVPSEDLNEARNELRLMNVPDNFIKKDMRNFARQFIGLRYSYIREFLRHRKLPYPVLSGAIVRSDSLGPLIVGKIDISEYEDEDSDLVNLNIRELKHKPGNYQDGLQVSIYGILKSSELGSAKSKTKIRTFLDYVPYGPMGIEVLYEKAQQEARRLAAAVVEILKKSKNEVKKKEVKK